MRDHLDTDLVAAYVERRLGRDERRDVEAHVAECAECRQELADVTRLLGPARWRRHLSIALPALAAAAVLAVMLNPGPRPQTVLDAGPRLRPGAGTTVDGIVSLAVHAPTADRSVARAGLRFTWASEGRDATYTLTLADTTGRTLWQLETPDTSLAAPDSLVLPAPATYHWWVDVRVATGREATTGIQSFVLVR